MTAKARAPHGSHNRPSGLNWSWQNSAACRGEELVLFFGPEGERQAERDVRERKAKAVCARCPVRRECGDYSIGRPENYGLWAGLGEDERKAERRRRMRRSADRARLDFLAADAADEDLAPAEAAS